MGTFLTELFVSKVYIMEGMTGPDVLLLDIDLPNGCYPYNGNATTKLEVGGGLGWEYANRHFRGTKYARFSPKSGQTEGVLSYENISKPSVPS